MGSLGEGIFPGRIEAGYGGGIDFSNGCRGGWGQRHGRRGRHDDLRRGGGGRGARVAGWRAPPSTPVPERRVGATAPAVPFVCAVRSPAPVPSPRSPAPAATNLRATSYTGALGATDTSAAVTTVANRIDVRAARPLGFREGVPVVAGGGTGARARGAGTGAARPDGQPRHRRAGHGGGHQAGASTRATLWPPNANDVDTTGLALTARGSPATTSTR